MQVVDSMALDVPTPGQVKSIKTIDGYQQWLLSVSHYIASGKVGVADRMPLLLEVRNSLSWLDQEGFYRHRLSLSVIEYLLDVTERLCDWSSLISLLDSVCPRLQEKQCQAFGVRDSDIKSQQWFSLLIYAHKQLGRSDIARDILYRELLASPENSKYIALWDDMQRQAQSMSPVQPSLSDKALMITPLSQNHIDDFIWQYSDSVKVLCHLGDFNNDDEWLSWLNTVQQDKSRAVFAIIHENLGFIGNVHLQVVNGCGIFYYWLGDDFRGYGFGPRAVKLLLDYGKQQMGMNCCYAKIYHGNVGSHKAIKKLGFQVLAFTAAKPYHEETFYYLGQPQSDHETFIGIKDMFYQLGCLLYRFIPDQQLIANG